MKSAQKQTSFTLYSRIKRYVSKQLAYKTALIGMLLSLSSSAFALGDQWYLGIGGGGSRLLPDTAESGVDVDEEIGETATIYFGRDFDDRSSGQIQLYSLGDAIFDTGDVASYVAGDASVLYRFYDSRDGRRGAVFGASIYGRFGFGFINRESTVELTGDAPVYFGIGGGIETYFTNNLGVRLEALYQEEDSATATLSLVTRFGGRNRPPPRVVTSPFGTPPADENTNQPANEVLTNPVQTPQARPVPVPEALPETFLRPVPQVPQPSTTQSAAVVETWTNELPDVELMATARETVDSTPVALPESPVSPVSPESKLKTDRDDDGISNTLDQCPKSTPDYPVDITGCSSFSDIARKLVFDNGSATLSISARNGVTHLAALMNRYPATKIELIAHTDNGGTEQTQSNLTRQRLRTLGSYLVQRGISQDRLLLRSYGGTRPAFKNDTPEGRQSNNRIEVFENP